MANLKEMVNKSLQQALGNLDMSTVINNSVVKALQHIDIERKVSSVLEQKVESYVEGYLDDALDTYVDNQLDCYDVSNDIGNYLEGGNYVNDYEIEEAITNELDNRDISGDVADWLAEKVETAVDGSISETISSWLDTQLEL